MERTMFFNDEDIFNEVAATCDALSMLPSAKDGDKADSTNEGDFAILVKASPYDSEDTEAYRVFGISGEKIDDPRRPMFGCADTEPKIIQGKELDNTLQEGIGLSLRNAFHGASQVECDAGLGFEGAYKPYDLVTLNKENMPHIFIVVCSDGEGYTLAKPTMNGLNQREGCFCLTNTDGNWPKCRCQHQDIAGPADKTLCELQFIMRDNDNLDKQLFELLCPDCDDDNSVCDNNGLVKFEAFGNKSFDESPMKSAQATRKAIAQGTKQVPKKWDGKKYVENTEEIFKKINTMLDHVTLKDNITYDAGPEVSYSMKGFDA